MRSFCFMGLSFFSIYLYGQRANKAQIVSEPNRKEIVQGRMCDHYHKCNSADRNANGIS